MAHAPPWRTGSTSCRSQAPRSSSRAARDRSCSRVAGGTNALRSPCRSRRARAEVVASRRPSDDPDLGRSAHGRRLARRARCRGPRCPAPRAGPTARAERGEGVVISDAERIFAYAPTLEEAQEAARILGELAQGHHLAFHATITQWDP